MAKPLVLPVSWPDANAWLHGALSDKELLLHSALTPQAVFGALLPGIKENRELVTRIAYWRTRGADCLIFRTHNPIVGRHYERHGAVPILKELIGKETSFRYLMPPGPFHKFFHRFGTWHATAAILALLLCVTGQAMAACVTLAWNASTGPLVAGTKIFYGVASGAYTTNADAGHATNVTIGGLTPGTNYFFAAATYNVAGMTSPFCREVSYRVPLPIWLSISRQFGTNHSLTNLTVTASSAPATAWAWEASTNQDLALAWRASNNPAVWSTIATGAPGVLPVLKIPTSTTNPPEKYIRLHY